MDNNTLSIVRTRRTAVKSLALGAVVPLIPMAEADASASLASKSANSTYRYKVGNFEVTAVYDGYFPLDAETFITNQPASTVQQVLSDLFLPTNIVPTPLTPIVVNTGTSLVLIDTGDGDHLPNVAGHAVKNLRSAGINPEDIDTVLLTHFHVDHLCGLRLNEGTYQFPNAKIYVPEGEWSFWMDDGNQSRAPDRQQVYFSNARRVFLPITDRVERFGPGQEVVPGIRSIATPGHTPGHSSFMISSEGKDLLVWGDTSNHTDIALRFPLWTPSADMDQQLALKNRLRMLDMAITDRLRVSCFHAPFPANGYIKKLSDHEYRLVPLQWTENIDGW